MESIIDIYNKMAEKKSQQAALSELAPDVDTVQQLTTDINSGSRVARWRLIMWIVATVMWMQRAMWELFKKDVQRMADAGHFGTKRWFVDKALKFQLGSDLILTTNDAYYETIIPEERVVDYAAAVEAANKVIVMAARKVGDDLAPLTPEQAIGLHDFFQQQRPPVIVQIRTAEGDELHFAADVVFDAEQGLSNIQPAVEAAVRNYLQSKDFNGVLNRTKLKAAILEVPGVEDVYITALRAKIMGGDWQNITRVHYPFSGWMKISGDYQLSNTLNYVASNV